MQENINIPDSTITTNLSFRNLVLMNMQQLTNFPYIEKDFDALTDYELLCLVVKYLNDVIANQNEQNASITRMYQSFLALQDYVNNTKDELEDAFNNLDDYVRNYFDNLDVQEEINNKLDQMLEDGVLEQIIEQFLQSTALWCFDNVESMKQATNLINGSYAKTLGYYSINDGGGATYKITNTESQTEYQEELNNGLYATLIIDKEINVKQFGAKGDGTTDDTQKINDIISILKSFYNENNYSIKTLFFPSGNYKVTSTITIPNFITLKTNGNVTFSSSSENITLLFDNSSVNGNTNYENYHGEKIEGNFTIKNINETRGNTIAIQLQSTNSQTGTQNFNAFNEIKNINIKNFHIGINFIMKNLFLKTFKNIIIQYCDYGIYFNNIISNSGAKITFDNLTLGNCINGIYINARDLELNIINSSIDLTDKGITVTENGVITKLTNCHFETIGFNNNGEETAEENPYLYKSLKGFYGYNMLMLTNCDYMTIRSKLIQSQSANGVNVFLKGVVSKGSDGFNKLFALCDDNCNLITNEFLSSIYLMMIIQDKQNQKIESNFANIENQNLTNYQEITGYTFSNEITGRASISNEKIHTSGKSIKYVVPNGGAYFKITSEEYNVIPNTQLFNSLFYYFDTSYNKGIRYSVKTNFYDKDNNLLPYPTSIISEADNLNNSTPNEWNRPYQFEQVTVPSNAVKAQTIHTFNPTQSGTLYITDFYRANITT